MCRYFPVGRGGSTRPPKQTNCTTGWPNRTDSGRCRLPEETFTIRAWSRQTLSPGLGAAPASVAAADISASLPEVCLPGSLVMPDQREVCPLARQGDVATPIRPITERHSLSPSSFTRCPVGSLCRSLSLDPLGLRGREDNRLTTFRRCPRVDRTHLYAGGSTSAPEEFGAPGPGTWPLTFWSKRFSSLRLFCVTTPTMLYLGWPYHSILVPNHHCCWQSQLRLTPWLPSQGRRLRCPGAY